MHASPASRDGRICFRIDNLLSVAVFNATSEHYAELIAACTEFSSTVARIFAPASKNAVQADPNVSLTKPIIPASGPSAPLYSLHSISPPSTPSRNLQVKPPKGNPILADVPPHHQTCFDFQNKKCDRPKCRFAHSDACPSCKVLAANYPHPCNQQPSSVFPATQISEPSLPAPAAPVQPLRPVSTNDVKVVLPKGKLRNATDSEALAFTFPQQPFSNSFSFTADPSIFSTASSSIFSTKSQTLATPAAVTSSVPAAVVVIDVAGSVSLVK